MEETQPGPMAGIDWGLEILKSDLLLRLSRYLEALWREHRCLRDSLNGGVLDPCGLPRGNCHRGSLPGTLRRPAFQDHLRLSLVPAASLFVGLLPSRAGQLILGMTGEKNDI